LLEKIIQKTEGAIHHIVITHSQDNIYYATIVLQKGENLVEIDARPSDSLVMALKFNAPIYVSRALFEKMSLPLKSQTEMEESYGLSLQEVTPDLAKYLSFEPGKGVMVSDVQRGSPAERDGVRKGDIIVEVEGQTVENMIVFKKSFEKKPAKMKVFRNSQYLILTIHPK
jgi:membrane-associated protease RseP (regulator of RpoE activity)